MNTLVIETAMHKPFVAIFSDCEVLHFCPLPQKRSLASALIAAMKDVSEKFPIDQIAAGIGPGSYTGSRVGAVAAEHYAFAKNIPLIPFCSLLPYIKDNSPVYLEGKGDLYFIQEAVTPFSTRRASSPEGVPVSEVELRALIKKLNLQRSVDKLDLLYLHSTP